MVTTLRSGLSQLLKSRRQQPLTDTLQTSALFPSRPICKLYSVSSRLHPVPTSRLPATQTQRRFLSHPLPQTSRQITAPKITSCTPPFPIRTFTTTARTMGSDEDYMAFLNKANEDPSKGTAKAQGSGAAAGEKKPFRTTQQGVEVPAVLQRVCGGDERAFYVSDADEPFEAVALGWDEGGRGLPDEEEFAGLIGHWDPKSAEVQILDPVDWDRSGQYKEVLDAVREAGEGNDVRVYRVGRGGVRFEYWVVTTEGKGKGAKLVGAKVLAVES